MIGVYTPVSVLIGAGPDADRRANPLISLAVEGSLLDAYSNLSRQKPCPLMIRFNFRSLADFGCHTLEPGFWRTACSRFWLPNRSRITASLNIVADRSFNFLAETPQMEDAGKWQGSEFSRPARSSSTASLSIALSEMSHHTEQRSTCRPPNIPQAVTLNRLLVKSVGIAESSGAGKGELAWRSPMEVPISQARWHP